MIAENDFDMTSQRTIDKLWRQAPIVCLKRSGGSLAFCRDAVEQLKQLAYEHRIYHWLPPKPNKKKK
jgi:hypothetical protein